MRYKPVQIVDDSDLEHFYDEVDLNSDQSNGRFRFFSPNPTGDDTVQNYLEQPFSRENDYYMVGLGFQSLLIVIKEDSTIDPVKIINTLAVAVVRLTTNGGRERILHEPLANYFDLSSVEVTSGPTGLRHVVIPTMDAWRLAVPLILRGGIPFELYVELGTFVSDLPSAANWATSGQSGGKDWGLRCKLQYALMRDPQPRA